MWRVLRTIIDSNGIGNNRLIANVFDLLTNANVQCCCYNCSLATGLVIRLLSIVSTQCTGAVTVILAAVVVLELISDTRTKSINDTA